jgi:AcrR family transcriptional regulator
MAPRRYSSTIRAAAAAEKRARVLDAAAALLREDAGISGFSLEAVAGAAGVTRLTVYNQFGSRRGLLEAVFDEVAIGGGLTRIPDAMALADARVALDRLVDIFCDFWNGDPAIGNLHGAMAIDPEFAQALTERNERRRTIFNAIVRRVAGKSVPLRTRQDAADLIFTLTSCATFTMLRQGRSAERTRALVKAACNDALDTLQPSSPVSGNNR